MKCFLLILTLTCLFHSFSYANTDSIIPFDTNLNRFINIRDFTIDKHSSEAYFTVQSPGQEIAQIVVTRRIDKQWTTPELLPFCDEFMYMEPFLTQDGKRLFFASDRPTDANTKQRKDFDIWYVERPHAEALWSEPINVGPPVNSELDEFYPSLSANNNLYFTKVSPEGMGNDDLYYCIHSQEGYSSPILLPESINSKGFEFNAYISKKEDFIIFTRYNDPDGLGSGDLYISYKDSNEVWMQAYNLGAPVNTKMMEYCPYYNEENQILYFTSRRNSIISQKFKNISELQNYISNSENGLSKIYQYKIDLAK